MNDSNTSKCFFNKENNKDIENIEMTNKNEFDQNELLNFDLIGQDKNKILPGDENFNFDNKINKNEYFCNQEADFDLNFFNNDDFNKIDIYNNVKIDNQLYNDEYLDLYDFQAQTDIYNEPFYINYDPNYIYIDNIDYLQEDYNKDTLNIDLNNQTTKKVDGTELKNLEQNKLKKNSLRRRSKKSNSDIDDLIKDYCNEFMIDNKKAKISTFDPCFNNDEKTDLSFGLEAFNSDNFYKNVFKFDECDEIIKKSKSIDKNENYDFPNCFANKFKVDDKKQCKKKKYTRYDKSSFVEINDEAKKKRIYYYENVDENEKKEFLNVIEMKNLRDKNNFIFKNDNISELLNEKYFNKISDDKNFIGDKTSNEIFNGCNNVNNKNEMNDTSNFDYLNDFNSDYNINCYKKENFDDLLCSEINFDENNLDFCNFEDFYKDNFNTIFELNEKLPIEKNNSKSKILSSNFKNSANNSLFQKKNNELPIENDYEFFDSINNNFPCTIPYCNNSYSSITAMKFHLKNKHGKILKEMKPIKCKIDGCQKSFRSRGGFSYHKRKFHLKNDNIESNL